jgi:hypothetical protein
MVQLDRKDQGVRESPRIRMLMRPSLVSVNSYHLGNTKATKGGAKKTPILSQNEIRKIRQETEKGTKVDGVVISKTELDRIRRSTRITTKE